MTLFNQIMTKNTERLKVSLKKFSEPGGYPETTRGGAWGRGWNFLNWKFANPNSKIDYKAKVGNVMGNSIVAGGVDWIKLNFREAPPMIAKKDKDGKLTVLPDHKLTKLLHSPSKKYSGQKLWGDMLESYLTNGNGYWLKIWNVRHVDVVELNYIPHELIEPFWDNAKKGEFIQYYEYIPGGPQTEIEKIPVKDIVHFRNGRDPENNRKGLAPIQSCLREIAIDNEATNFGYQMLENYGTPSMLIAPKSDEVILKPGAGDKIRNEFDTRVKGDQRGSIMVLSAGVDVTKMGFNPKEMDLNNLHKTPEERICAILKIPAMVLGLGTGGDKANSANMKDSRKAAIENCIIPLQNALGSEIETQLLPDFEENPEEFCVVFDLDKIRALQADQNQLAMTTNAQFTSNVVTRAEARRKQGYPASKEDERYNFEIMGEFQQEMTLEQMANALENQTNNPTNNTRATNRAGNASDNAAARDSTTQPRNVEAPGNNPAKPKKDFEPDEF